MNFLELAKARYSVRSFKKDAIEDEKLQAILEAGRVAPSACNKQPQKIYVVQSRQMREKLASVCRFTFDAPVVLAICYDRDKAWKNDLTPGYCSGETDAAIVCTHMMLEAWELGIGSCWVAWFNADEVHAALSLPENVNLCALLPIGYPAEDSAPSKSHSRIREFDETIRFM